MHLGHAQNHIPDSRNGTHMDYQWFYVITELYSNIYLNYYMTFLFKIVALF